MRETNKNTEFRSKKQHNVKEFFFKLFVRNVCVNKHVIFVTRMIFYSLSLSLSLNTSNVQYYVGHFKLLAQSRTCWKNLVLFVTKGKDHHLNEIFPFPNSSHIKTKTATQTELFPLKRYNLYQLLRCVNTSKVYLNKPNVFSHIVKCEFSLRATSFLNRYINTQVMFTM